MSNHLPGKLHAISLKKLSNGWHADGGNLYLFVRDTSRSWVFRYTSPNGKRRNKGVGSLNSVSLARAREVASILRAQVNDPLSPSDPIETAHKTKTTKKIQEARGKKFSDCAEAYIESNKRGWKNKKHSSQWANTLSTYAYPILADLPVDSIETSHIVNILQPIWSKKTETASRVRGRIESVLNWAKVSGYRDGDNPAQWRGHLDQILPAPTKVAKVKHHSALPYKQLPLFMNRLQTRQGIGAIALKFTILTCARSGETRMATWEEIDLEENVWVIPAGRMKNEKEHKVALSAQAVNLLNNISPSSETNLIFPGSKVKKPMSDATLSSTLKRMDQSDATVHGFRSTFRDWAAECTSYPREASELCLAHSIGSAVELAYRRGDMFNVRRQLMQSWADYCWQSIERGGN